MEQDFVYIDSIYYEKSRDSVNRSNFSSYPMGQDIDFYFDRTEFFEFSYPTKIKHRLGETLLAIRF